MTQKEILRDLLLHMEWADAAAWKAVLAHPAAATDDRTLKLFYHLHLVQYSFGRVWRGEPRETAYPAFTGAVAMMRWAKEWFPGASAYLAGADAGSLSAPMVVPWSTMAERRLGRVAGVTTLGDTVLQVAMHSQYHRAQVNARLKELGGTPPLVDYIAWIWYGKPGAEWKGG